MATGIAQSAGLTRLALLGIGGGGTAYSNANARIGVGDDDTAPTAADGTLLGTAVWKAMDGSFPVTPPLLNTFEFQATFAAGTITNPIKEVCADNGAGTHEALARIVLAVADQFTPGGSDIIRVNVKDVMA